MVGEINRGSLIFGTVQISDSARRGATGQDFSVVLRHTLSPSVGSESLPPCRDQRPPIFIQFWHRNLCVSPPNLPALSVATRVAGRPSQGLCLGRKSTESTTYCPGYNSRISALFTCWPGRRASGVGPPPEQNVRPFVRIRLRPRNNAFQGTSPTGEHQRGILTHAPSAS